MPVIPLKYGEHWNWAHFDTDPYVWKPANPAAKLVPEIHKWISEHKVRHSFIHDGAVIEAICILDPQKAMLFKLTWM